MFPKISLFLWANFLVVVLGSRLVVGDVPPAVQQLFFCVILLVIFHSITTSPLSSSPLAPKSNIIHHDDVPVEDGDFEGQLMSAMYSYVRSSVGYLLVYLPAELRGKMDPHQLDLLGAPNDWLETATLGEQTNSCSW